MIRISVDDNAPITRLTFATLGFQGVTGPHLFSWTIRVNLVSRCTGHGKPERILIRPSLLSKLQLMREPARTSSRKPVREPAAGAGTRRPDGRHRRHGSGREQVETGGHRRQGDDAQLGPQRVNIPAMVQEANTTLKSRREDVRRAGLAAVQTKHGPRRRLQESGPNRMEARQAAHWTR